MEDVEKPTWLNRIVLGFALTSLLSDLGHELVTSITPGFLSSIGAAPIALGLIEGVSGVASSLANLWSGHRADRVSNRVPYLIAGYLATALKALYALVSFWPWLVAIRTLGWIGRGVRGSMRDSLIAENVHPSAYGRAHGFREAMDTVGALGGPVLGALLLTSIGYRGLFLISAIPGALSVLMIVLFIRDKRLSVSSAVAGTPSSSGDVQLPQAFWGLVVADTVFSIGNIAPSFFILAVIFGLSAHVGTAQASAIGVALYAWHNFIYSAVAMLAGRLADHIGARKVLLTGYAVLVLALAGFAASPSNILFYAVLFTLTGISTGMQESVQKTYISLTLDASVRGRGLGIHASAIGWGGLVSGVMLGALWSVHRASLGFVIAAVAVALSIALIWSRVPEQLAA